MHRVGLVRQVKTGDVAPDDEDGTYSHAIELELAVGQFDRVVKPNALKSGGGYGAVGRSSGGGYGSGNRSSGGGYGSEGRSSGGGYGSDNRSSGGGYGSDNRSSGGGYGSDSRRPSQGNRSSMPSRFAPKAKTFQTGSKPPYAKRSED